MDLYKLVSDQCDPVYFAKYADVEPSLRISYSACQSVDIVKSPSPIGGPVFIVTGMVAYGDKAPTTFKHTFKLERFTLHEAPTHL